jgi:hypothetical protein
MQLCRWHGCDLKLCMSDGLLGLENNEVCQWLAAGQWFSLVSSTNKTNRHDITEILLKVALNTTTVTP